MNTQTLNDRMEFGHVIRVAEDGTVTDSWLFDAPESIYVQLDSDGQMIGSDSREGVDALAFPIGNWAPLSGYTGQYGSTARSFIMHESEYVGGRMETDILSEAGYYVAVTVEGLPDDENGETEPVGWAVLYRPLEGNE